jgi:hypothetical protein
MGQEFAHAFVRLVKRFVELFGVTNQALIASDALGGGVGAGAFL